MSILQYSDRGNYVILDFAHGNEYRKAVMSEVMIEDLALMIHVGDDSSEVFVTRSVDSHAMLAEVHLQRSMQFTVADLIADERLEGNRLPMRSQDFVAADMELRAILLANNLDISPTQYWYTVGDAANTEDLYLEDIDPETHTTVTIGNHTRSFSPTQLNTTDFINGLLQSGLCEGYRWNSHLLEINLPWWLATDEERGQTFQSILSLYQPGN